MLFNQLAEWRFSAIAASFNPAVERDCAKTARVFPDIIGAKAPNAGVKARSAGEFKRY